MGHYTDGRVWDDKIGAWVFEKDEASNSRLIDGVNAELLEEYKKIRKAAECIHHWHDAHNGGMIVSGEHVRKLWQVLSETRSI